MEIQDRTLFISSGLLCMQGKLPEPWHLLPGFNTIMAPGDLSTLATRKCSNDSNGTEPQRRCGLKAMAKLRHMKGQWFLSPGAGDPSGELSPPESMGNQEGPGNLLSKTCESPRDRTLRLAPRITATRKCVSFEVALTKQS